MSFIVTGPKINSDVTLVSVGNINRDQRAPFSLVVIVSNDERFL
jgi:hypothetical protein